MDNIYWDKRHNTEGKYTCKCNAYNHGNTIFLFDAYNHGNTIFLCDAYNHGDTIFLSDAYNHGNTIFFLLLPDIVLHQSTHALITQ